MTDRPDQRDLQDPMDVLRMPAVPVRPRPEFARRLLAALTRQLRAGDVGGAAGVVATTEQPLVPYLCASDARAALDFYRAAFGAVEEMRVTGDDGRIGHMELVVGPVRLMLSDEYPEVGVVSPSTLGNTPAALHLDVEDVDAVYRAAVDAGATGLRPPEDQSHGNRTATLLDPSGHRWMLSQRIEELTLAEYAAREAGAGGFTVTAPDGERDDEPRS
jgi:uncharacterized glyoxalase superfamily protein PhnB